MDDDDNHVTDNKNYVTDNDDNHVTDGKNYVTDDKKSVSGDDDNDVIRDDNNCASGKQSRLSSILPLGCVPLLQVSQDHNHPHHHCCDNIAILAMICS